MISEPPDYGALKPVTIINANEHISLSRLFQYFKFNESQNFIMKVDNYYQTNHSHSTRHSMIHKQNYPRFRPNKIKTLFLYKSTKLSNGISVNVNCIENINISKNI